MALLAQIQNDVRAALKAGERERAQALRMLANALQNAHKDARGRTVDEVEILRRERKRRLEAAEAYERAGDSERARAERAEAELIDGYLPQPLATEELARIVDEAIAETGASEPRDVGKVMAAVMPRVRGRADGAEVSRLVKERLAA
ncbi:GatB/YqeY domain-containing protein [Thermoleophilum album]|uniref:GatB/YqeY domain-containing protein n=1 Tax=Thermoleophilum album TaxID=29539 RepID=UPI00237CEB4E|nr:GatB/YqeY domain-containing protein [Thermoleophilum album]WDT92966.1 GatB/YqeY domain-containing protein [Thermoleophilum album]